MGKRELVALLNLSSWCLAVVEWLFLVVPWGCLRFEIVIFPDHTHLLFYINIKLFPYLFNFTTICDYPVQYALSNQDRKSINTMLSFQAL